MNLAHYLEQSAFFFPDRPAVRQDGVETTYSAAERFGEPGRHCSDQNGN